MVTSLCKYDLRKGDLFVLSWATVRRVRRGSISSELLMCGGGVRIIVELPLVARFLETIIRFLSLLLLDLCDCLCSHVVVFYLSEVVFVPYVDVVVAMTVMHILFGLHVCIVGM